MHARLLSYALFAVFPCLCSAQNVIEPCGDFVTDPYHGRVIKRIDAAIAQPPSLQWTTFLSFEPESGLRLVGNEVYFVQFKSSFWANSYRRARDGSYRMDFARPKIVTATRHAPLSDALARRIERVYSSAIARAKPSNWQGVDGVIYAFSSPDGACAKAWSPQPGTPNARLVDLMERLEKHTRFSAQVDLQRSEKAVLQLLQALEKE